MLKKMGLELRTTIQLSVVAILGLSCMIGFVSYRARTLMEQEAFDKTREIAAHYGQEVGVQLMDALSATRALAKTFEAAVADRDAIDRKMFLRVIEKSVEANPFFFGTWVQFEPNKFDGKNEQFLGVDGFPTDGAFMPYASREGDGITLDVGTGTYEDYKDMPYYVIPLQAKQECIINPYVEPDADNVLMSSTCVPIFENEQVIGVAGIDLVLTEMSSMVSKIKPFNTGYAYLVSNEGTFVGHPNQDLAGKNIADFGATPEILGHIKAGEEAEQFTAFEGTGEPSYSKFVPVRIGNTTTPWSFVVVVPLSTVMAGANGIMWVTLTIGATTLLALLLATYVVARSIARPLHAAIEALAMGAEQVDQAAGQVAESSQSMAEGASEQASSLEETSASIEEMSSMTKHNAESSLKASNMMKEAHSSITSGNEAVHQMSAAIDGIKKAADETAKIIKTIDNIAFQTNLLALNAAVEAARAGEAGKGFAVVAEEVRNLAQRSAEAARSTGALIEESQKSADRGVEVATKVNQAFGLIAESASGVGSLIDNIASASKEQSVGIEQINKAISLIDTVTQSNAASSEEAASASEELSAQAKELAAIVDELVALVGGRTPCGQVDSTPPQRMVASRQQQHAHQQKFPKVANTHTAACPMALAGQDTIFSPGQVIPLDPSDLEEF